jgi:uncharacterized membrane protein YgcG
VAKLTSAGVLGSYAQNIVSFAQVMNKMKKGNSKSLGCAVFICCVTFLFCFSAQASAQEEATSLMLEVSPPEGGSLNVVPGVHSYDMYAAVTLVATPKPGYQFVCWLGNVSDTTTGTTLVFLDSPKMVIAVFERNKFETTAEDDETAGGGGEGGGGLTSSSSGFGVGGGGGIGGGTTQQSGNSSPSSPNDVPVPVPEPVSAALFFGGVLMLVRSRRNAANITT